MMLIYLSYVDEYGKLLVYVFTPNFILQVYD